CQHVGMLRHTLQTYLLHGSVRAFTRTVSKQEALRQTQEIRHPNSIDVGRVKTALRTIDTPYRGSVARSTKRSISGSGQSNFSSSAAATSPRERGIRQ
ncbi:hypothetical protein, partial [Gemmatimonas sp.]|uniref:hypothetical protein n=1 Tax=Gemmatimonas sp. TaxID=1962908 RepID=UPI003982E178